MAQIDPMYFSEEGRESRAVALAYRRVVDDPEDASYRDAFAEAMEGVDPEHAAFIRVDRAFCARRAQSANRDALFWELRNERMRLWNKVHRRILENFEPIVARPFVRHGMVEGGRLSGAEFLKRADLLFSSMPLRHLELHKMRRALRKILADDRLLQIVSLDLDETGLRDKHLALIAECPRLANLRFLSLIGNPVGEDGIRALAASAHLRGLAYVALARTQVPAIAPEPWYDQGEIFAFGEDPPLGLELVRDFGPRRWLLRRDRVSPTAMDF